MTWMKHELESFDHQTRGLVARQLVPRLGERPSRALQTPVRTVEAVNQLFAARLSDRVLSIKAMLEAFPRCFEGRKKGIECGLVQPEPFQDVGLRKGLAESGQGQRPKCVRHVVDWADLHRRELLENWQLARQGAPLRPIEPLQ